MSAVTCGLCTKCIPAYIHCRVHWGKMGPGLRWTRARTIGQKVIYEGLSHPVIGVRQTSFIDKLLWNATSSTSLPERAWHVMIELLFVQCCVCYEQNKKLCITAKAAASKVSIYPVVVVFCFIRRYVSLLLVTLQRTHLHRMLRSALCISRGSLACPSYPYMKL